MIDYDRLTLARAAVKFASMANQIDPEPVIGAVITMTLQRHHHGMNGDTATSSYIEKYIAPLYDSTDSMTDSTWLVYEIGCFSESSS